MSSTGALQSIDYTRGSLKVLDQLKVPKELVYREVKNVDDGVDAIRTMQIRGAPLIAMVGCLSLAVEIQNGMLDNKDKAIFITQLEKKIDELINARPTAVNMRKEGLKLVELDKDWSANLDLDQLKTKIVTYIESLLETDVETNKQIGHYGAADILKSVSEGDKVNVLTHCNTGSLATAGYGTALGVVRSLYQQQRIDHVYFTETRPYNQGARLTSFELLHENIPSTLICDSAASWLMKNKKINAVVVGADRVARNGDTANKVGTYQLAVTAKAHGVNFYIAAPFSTIDPATPSGNSIVIEQRPAEEVTKFAGVTVTPEGVQVWNPSFDVTPAELITGIITESGVFTPEQLAAKL